MRLALAVSFSIALSSIAAMCAPARAAAQETDYADSTGLTWGVAAFEVGLIATVIGAAILSGERSAATQDFALYGLLVSSVLSALAAGLAQGFGAPVEPPMLVHHGFTAGLLTGGLAASSVASTGVRGETSAWVGLGVMLAGAAGAVTYSALRMERLAYDPELVQEAHALSWAPLPAAGITAAVVALAGATDAAPILGALAGILTYAIAIGFVEDAISSHPPPSSTSGPLLRASGVF